MRVHLIMVRFESMKKQNMIPIVPVFSLVLVGLVIWFLFDQVPKNKFMMSNVESCVPDLIPTSKLSENLSSADTDRVVWTLWLLAGRKDPAALGLAIPLLDHADDYVWLAAAHYVGSCGRKEAVPYLIKSLRFTGGAIDGVKVAYLQSITGQSFGTDFQAWQSWWQSGHSDSEFDW
jgi:hypothetical protein